MTIESQLAALTAQTQALDATITTELADVNTDLSAVRTRVTALEISSGPSTGGGGGSGTSTAVIPIVDTLPDTSDTEGATVSYDSKLYLWNGTSWVQVEGGTTSDAPPGVVVVSELPTTAAEGDVVYNREDGYLYERTNGNWAQVSVNVNTSTTVADASLTVAKFASGLRPIEVVSAFPTTGNVVGRIIFLTTDSKIYRYDGTAYIKGTATSDLTGYIGTDLIEANAITTGKIQAGAITASQIAADSINSSKIAAGSITSDKVAANAITATHISTAAITSDKIASNSITAGKIAAASIGTSQLAAGSITATNLAAGAVTADKLSVATLSSISANLGTITAGSISADLIKAGSSTVSSGYTFALGSGQTFNGYPAAVGGSNSNSGGMGIAGYITNSSSAGWGATTGATVSTTGMGGAFYNATSTSFNSFRTFGGFGHGDWGGSMIYHRSWGTTNNGSLPPKTICYGGTSGDGLYAAYWGTTASNRLTDLFGGTAGAGAVARNYGSSGASIVTEANLATGSYSLYSTAGASYVSAGYLPFTGVHDGLVESADVFEPGDILVDHEVLERLDISNSVVTFKKSTVANEKGVIGVFVRSLDEVPEDWLPAEDKQSPTNEQYEVAPTAVRPNPGAFDIPSNMKVAHVNALGEGQINVCGEGGTIEKGDLIVTSSIPGKGMKQADDIVRGYTVAKARETVTFSSPSEIKQISCIYLAG